jgi:hypothetical protein
VESNASKEVCAKVKFKKIRNEIVIAIFFML